MSHEAGTTRTSSDVSASERPEARSVEQDVAGGRTAATPVAALLGVIVTVAGVVAVVLMLVYVAVVLT